MVLGALKKLFQPAEPCAGCDPAILKQCRAAEAGTVTPHAWHVFVRTPPPPGTSAAAPGESWWPERVEDELPAIASLAGALKDAGERIHGKAKVTVFDYMQPREQRVGTADVFVFPEGVCFQALPLERLNATVVDVLVAATFRRTGGGTGPTAEEQAVALSGSRAAGTLMFVCCHTARDARCGHIGPPLVDRLAQSVAQRGLDGGIRVLKTSHVGGHVYAGNVVVFSHGKQYHGDWFGGLNAGNADAFVEALLSCKAASGAPGDYSLRSWWRGRIGMTKEQQQQCFDKGLRDIEEIGIE